MKYIWLVLLILLLGCTSSAESSFQSLNQAFISWYYKFHPVEATRFGIKEFNETFRLIGNSENAEYVADISRFIIELSQIDATKLSAAEQIDYKILYFQLEKMRFIMNDIRPWEWNPLWILDEISEGLFLLSERPNIDMNIRVKAVQERLKSVPEMLNQCKMMMTSYSPLHIEHGNRRIDGIMNLMDKLPLKLNSDNLTLDDIDRSIIICKKSLLNFKKWMTQNAVHMPLLQFPQNLELSDHAFPYFIENRYVSEHVYKLAEKKLIPTQNRIFTLTLPIYLADNDEPVWLDRDDTLEVIHWTIDHIHNEPEFQVPAEGIVAHFYNSISKLEEFIDLKDLIPKNIRKRVKLAVSPMHLQPSLPVSLFNYHPRKFNSEIIYYIKSFEETGSLFPLTIHEIDLLNARYIIPGRTVQIAHSQKYPSQIRYMFPDPINEAGWEIYSIQMIVDEKLDEWDHVYSILKLKEELIIICRAMVEDMYYSGKIDRKDALSFIKNQAFLNDSLAEYIMQKSDLHYFSGTQAFIGMMEINSLLAEYKRSQDSAFNLSNFHNIVLKDGIIPLYELKKQILSP